MLNLPRKISSKLLFSFCERRVSLQSTTMFKFFLILITFAFFLTTAPKAQAAAPTFISAGAVAADLSGPASVIPTMPTHQENDILLVSCYNASGNTMSTATSGWTEIAEVDGTGNIAWYWKRAAGAGTAGPDVTSSGTDQFCVGYVIRGAITTGTPYEDATTANDGTTAATTPDTALITTTNIDRFAVSVAGWDTNITWASGNPPSGWSADSTVNGTTGTGSGFGFISKTQAAAGDVSAVVIGTLSASVLHGTLTLAFIPPNASPTVALNTPADTSSTSDTTPTLNFTGTDAEAETIEYNVQVDTVNSFDSQTTTIASNSEGTQDTNAPLYYGTPGQNDRGQTFTPASSVPLTSVKFYLKKSGSPTKQLAISLWATSAGIPTGTALAVSNTFDTSTLTTSYQLIEFTFPTPYTLTAATLYAIGSVTYSIDGTDSGNQILFGSDRSSPGYADGTEIGGDTWATVGGDLNFYAYSNVPLLSKFSGNSSTYYFDASDATATDPQSVWTNDANAFDNDVTPSTFAQNNLAGSVSSNYLMAEGTNAPTSGGTISQVRARVFGVLPTGAGALDFNAAIYTNSLGELLGTATRVAGGSADWSSYVTLSTPTGGWTWQKVNDLETKIYKTSGGNDQNDIYKVEVSVTYSDAGFTAGYPFASGVAKDYTVQSALNAGTTYYWRVAATDPSGSDAYGAWSSTYSFLVTGPLDHYSLAVASPQTAGVCVTGTNTVTAQDASNNNLTDDTSTVNMTSSGTGITFYTASNCSSSTTSYTLSAGVANIYYKTNKAQSFTVTATKASSTETGTSSSITVNPGSHTRLVVTLPSQTFTAGTGNSGSVDNQTSGTQFTISAIRATDDYFNVITSYSGAKTLSYSGPAGSPTYTTSVSFTSGASTTTLLTTLTAAETTTITATDGGSYGYASSSLVVNAAGAPGEKKMRGGLQIRSGTKIQ